MLLLNKWFNSSHPFRDVYSNVLKVIESFYLIDTTLYIFGLDLSNIFSCHYPSHYLSLTHIQYLNNQFLLKWFFILAFKHFSQGKSNVHCVSFSVSPLGLIILNKSVLCSWPCNGSLNSKQRNIFESVKLRFSCFLRVALRHRVDGGSHFYCKAYARTMTILSHKIITSSQCDRNRLSLCWQWGTAATSVSFCMFTLETLKAETRISESPVHTIPSSVCIYHPWLDMLKNSVQPNQTCKQQKASAKRLADRTVPL